MMEGIPNTPLVEKQPSILEAEKLAALTEVVQSLSDRMKAPVRYDDNSPESGGESAVETAADALFAYGKTLEEKARGIHAESLKLGEYRGEQAAAKLYELVTTYQELINRIAELMDKYPEVVDGLKGVMPGVDDMVTFGDQRRESLQ